MEGKYKIKEEHKPLFHENISDSFFKKKKDGRLVRCYNGGGDQWDACEYDTDVSMNALELVEERIRLHQDRYSYGSEKRYGLSKEDFAGFTDKEIELHEKAINGDMVDIEVVEAWIQKMVLANNFVYSDSHNYVVMFNDYRKPLTPEEVVIEKMKYDYASQVPARQEAAVSRRIATNQPNRTWNKDQVIKMFDVWVDDYIGSANTVYKMRSQGTLKEAYKEYINSK